MFLKVQNTALADYDFGHKATFDFDWRKVESVVGIDRN